MALTLIQNVGLNGAATAGFTSITCEPTGASNNNRFMLTGNWFASTSNDAGATWLHVDPFTQFPKAGGGFCCDQVVLYNPRHDLWIWLLQYDTAPSVGNIFRLAVCDDSSFGTWRYWDVAPTDLDPSWTTLWFDYPDMAFTDDHLFITFNAFIGNAWKRSFVFRMPLASLAPAASLSYRWWATTRNGSIRLCRGLGATMYMGSHNPPGQIRLFQWADSATSISYTDITVRPYSNGPYSAPGPSSRNWLNRLDDRITGAWVGAGVIGFMWSASRDAKHPWPYIRVVRVDEASKTLVDEPDIWSASTGWAYPAAAGNTSGDVGISAYYGGSTHHPSHVVGFHDGAAWTTHVSQTSTDDPGSGAWGDYVSCHADHSDGTRWVAAGFTLQGGSARANIEPRIVRFHT
jgi:hypothetical protein